MDTIVYIPMNMFANTEKDFNNADIEAIMNEETPWDERIVAAKQYINKYFIKCRLPNCILHWDHSSKSIQMFSFENIGNFLINQEFANTLYDDKGKPVLVNRFAVLTWFKTKNFVFADLVMDINKPRYFEENNKPYVNLFGGFLHDSEEPDANISPDLQIVLDHLKSVWCSDNEKVFDYIIKWFARIVQRKKNRSLLYLKSGQGTGKSSITDFIREYVLGHNSTQLIDNPNEALADFNVMLEGCVYCVLEEPQQASKGEWHKLSNQLKILCTGSVIGIHKKYKDRYQIQNNVSLAVMTNHNALFVEQDDRRIVCLDVSRCKVGDKDYFNTLHKALNAESGKQLFKYLLSIDLEDFDELNDIPDTNTKRELKVENIPFLFEFIKSEYLQNNKGFKIKFADLFAHYEAHCDEKNHKGKLNKVVVSKQLAEVGINTKSVKRKEFGNSPVHFLDQTYGDLYAVFDTKGWIHEIDDIQKPE